MTEAGGTVAAGSTSPAEEPGLPEGPPRRLPQPAVPAPVAVPGVDPDRREHGPVRADGHRLGESVEHGRQPAHPVLPRAGGAVQRRRRRLCRPDRPSPGPHRDEPPAGGRDLRPRPRRRQLPAHPRAEHLHLDGHGVLRAGRGGDDPRGRAPPPAAVGERHLHADPQCGVRHRLRPARPAGHQRRRRPGGDHHRRRAVLPGRGLLLDAAASPRRRPGPRRSAAPVRSARRRAPGTRRRSSSARG